MLPSDSLTTAQQFELDRMRRASDQMSREQAQELLIQATRLLMIKTNVVLSLSTHGTFQPTSPTTPLSGDNQA